MHLSETFMDTVAYVVYFLKAANRKSFPFEQVRARVLALLNESGRAASEFPADEYDQARFAVCAWVDEAIVNSVWSERGGWQREPLQLKFYQTTNAGEIFFDRLNALAGSQNDVREVYYLCLAMGFMGRFCKDEDRFLLEQLKTSNLKVLTGSSAGLPSLKKSRLFPEAYPDESRAAPAKAKARFGLQEILLAASPVALFGVLYLIYSFVLGSVSASLFVNVP
jgi:type VI secretion system protein ImpK